MVDKVVCWTNGMVMAFDEKGQQMPDYQGRFDDVKREIAALKPEPREYVFGCWNAGETLSVSRDGWFGSQS